MLNISDQTVSLYDCEKEDLRFVGDRAVMFSELAKNSFPVQDGFIVTVNSLSGFLRYNKLSTKIKHLLGGVNTSDPVLFSKALSTVRAFIKSSEVPEETVREVFAKYKNLGKNSVVYLSTSSVTHEQKYYKDGIVEGESALIEMIKEIWAHFYNPQTLFQEYLHEQIFKTPNFAVIVQKAIFPEASGFLFTTEPGKNDKTEILIKAKFGLQDVDLQSKSYDSYVVKKPDVVYSERYPVPGFTIDSKKINPQDTEYKRTGLEVKKQYVKKAFVNTQKISDTLILELSSLGQKIEDYFFLPQRVEWAVEKGIIYIANVYPMSPNDREKEEILQNIAHEDTVRANRLLKADGHQAKVVLAGEPVSHGIGIGKIKILRENKGTGDIHTSDILVLPSFKKIFDSAVKKAAGVIILGKGKESRGIMRDAGVPAVQLIEEQTDVLKDGMTVTVNGNTGEIYKGSMHFLKTETQSPKNTATKLYLDLSNGNVSHFDGSGADGIGVINSDTLIKKIGIHPKKISENNEGFPLQATIEEHVETFCKEVFPKPVFYQLNNFTTLEYKKLIGGKSLEAHEDNPKMGYRGVLRMVDDRDLLRIELEAIRKLKKKGNTNLNLIISHVRTIQEFAKIKSILEDYTLKRSYNFKIYLSVDYPSTAICIDEFIKSGIDGVIVNIRNITSFTLGLDSLNPEIQHSFNEEEPSVFRMIEGIAKTSHESGIFFGVRVDADHFSQTLLEKLIRVGAQGIVAPYYIKENAKKMLAQAEIHVLNSTSGIKLQTLP